MIKNQSRFVIFRRASIALGVGLLFALYHFQAAVWMPYRYIRLYGKGDVAAERAVEQWIRKWSRLNLLTRTDRIATYVMQSPWVDTISVYKSFDGGLNVQLVYKKPVLRSISGRYAIDDRGRTIDALVSDDLLKLPVFSGDAQSAKMAYKLWSRLHAWKHRLLQISVDEFSGWELHFDNKVTVRLGVKNLMQRLDLYLKVAKHWSLLDAVEEQVFDMRYNNSFSHKKIS